VYVCDVCMCCYQIHRIYGSTGASFAKAQQELAQGVLSSKTVQQTAGNMAASAARATVTSAAARYSPPLHTCFSFFTRAVLVLHWYSVCTKQGAVLQQIIRLECHFNIISLEYLFYDMR